MSEGRKIIRRIMGATDIALYDGGHLLVGRPSVFGAEYREFIEADKPGLTERIIRNISEYASHGSGRLHEVLIHFDGFGNLPFTAKGISDRVLALVRRGSLLALVMPAVALNALTTDKAQLEAMSGDLQRQTPVNAEMSIEGKTIADLPEMTDKLVYVFQACKKYFSLKSVGEAFANAMTMTAIISTAVVLAAWAASHFFGVGFAIDVILIAVGFIMMGWAIFSAMRGLWKCVKKIHYADSMDDLDDAAKMFAQVVTDFGVELFIGILTRGAGKMRAKAGPKPEAGGGSAGGAKPKTKSEIEADNKAKADAARIAPPPKSLAAFKDDVHPGLHNRGDISPKADDFKTRREVDLDNLSPEDAKIKKAMERQGRDDPEEIKQLLSSGTGKGASVNDIKKGDKLYGFSTKGYGKDADSMYWMDEKALRDVESKYYKDGAWDREGVKGYLALPCYNSANDIVTATAKTDGSVIQTTIGKATEQLTYITKGGDSLGTVGKIMGGGGTQITPPPGLLNILPPHGGG